MATASFIASTTGTANGASTLALAKPAGVSQFDVLFAVIGVRNSSITVSPPVGWQTITDTRSPDAASSSAYRQYVFWKAASSGESSTFTFTLSVAGDGAAVLLAYRGVDNTSPVGAHAESRTTDTANPTAPSITTTAANRVVLTIYGIDQSTTWSRPAGLTARGAVESVSGVTASILAADLVQATAGPTGATSATWSPQFAGADAVTQRLEVLEGNLAPNAPALTSPVGDTLIDRTITQRFTWAFSDPDAGDSQSKFDLRYRIVGAGSWTTATVATPNQFYDFAPGTFVAGDYEWQARTYDALGLVGPWSVSSFFTAGDPPAAPTITAPTSGAAVAVTETLTWSTPDQDAYQVRRVADNAGTIDTSTVYSDTGVLVDGLTRSITVAFPTNDRWEWLQVRVKDGGLWSPWASIRVQVSWTPPPVPTVTWVAVPAEGAIDVTITNPSPGAGEPTVSYNDVYFAEPGEAVKRRATLVPPNSTWRHWGPTSSPVSYTYTVTAVADNGTTSDSVPTS